MGPTRAPHAGGGARPPGAHLSGRACLSPRRRAGGGFPLAAERFPRERSEGLGWLRWPDPAALRPQAPQSPGRGRPQASCGAEVRPRGAGCAPGSGSPRGEFSWPAGVTMGPSLAGSARCEVSGFHARSPSPVACLAGLGPSVRTRRGKCQPRPRDAGTGVAALTQGSSGPGPVGVQENLLSDGKAHPASTE